MTKEEQQPLSNEKNAKKGCWLTISGKIAIAVIVITTLMAAIAIAIAFSLSKKDGT